MNDRVIGQYQYEDSPVHNMHATVKLVLLLAFFVMTVMTDSVIGFVSLALISIAAVLLSHLRFPTVFRPILKLWLFFLFIFFMNALFFETEHPIFSWWIFSLSYEGIKQGAIILMRVILVTFMANTFIMTTPPIEITHAISILISPLAIFRIPTRNIAMIISVSLQFVPLLLQEAYTIKMAQTARGAGFESKRIKDKTSAVMPMVIPIFLAAFRRADELSMAMEARGYRIITKKESNFNLQHRLDKKGQSI